MQDCCSTSAPSRSAGLFYGKDRRKVRVRVRIGGVGTSLHRLLRLIRKTTCLPGRVGRPRGRGDGGPVSASSGLPIARSMCRAFDVSGGRGAATATARSIGCRPSDGPVPRGSREGAVLACVATTPIARVDFAVAGRTKHQHGIRHHENTAEDVSSRGSPRACHQRDRACPSSRRWRRGGWGWRSGWRSGRRGRWCRRSRQRQCWQWCQHRQRRR